MICISISGVLAAVLTGLVAYLVFVGCVFCLAGIQLVWRRPSKAPPWQRAWGTLIIIAYVVASVYMLSS